MDAKTNGLAYLTSNNKYVVSAWYQFSLRKTNIAFLLFHKLVQDTLQ